MSMHKGPWGMVGRAVVLAFTLGIPGAASAQPEAGPYAFGEPAPQELIDRWAIAIPPDGEHLPPGGGTAAEGEKVYAAKCVACHGEDLGGVAGTGGAALIGGRGTLDSGAPVKTVESYWPYATTVFDFVRRAMPFTETGSLSDNDVYAVTAYILYRGNIIGKDEVIDATTLPMVDMPNRDGFVPDPRPDTHHYD